MATLATVARSEHHVVRSPNSRLEAVVDDGGPLEIAISLDGKIVVEPSELGMEIDGRPILGRQPKLLDTQSTKIDRVVEQIVQRKRAELRDRHNGLTMTFDGGYKFELRVFDEGVAYRWVSEVPGEAIVVAETMALRFPFGSESLFPEEESMISHNERLYPLVDLETLDKSRFGSLPALIDVPDVARVVFTEADLYNYPAMYLRGGDGVTLNATFPKFVLETRPSKDGPDRNVEIIKEAPYIAKTDGDRSFPWRVLTITDDDSDFLENEMVYLLSRPLELDGTSWIRPGRVAWDWYNANNIYGVDFESGINTATYKYYIDFASKFGLEYVILDEGWTKSTTNILESNPEIDVPELVAYGAERGVRIILWALWGPVDENAAEIFDLYQSWGVAGVKIDFMQRSDQYMVEYYERIAREAAKRQLLVDYHGAFKPAGLRRALPNVISYEGVKGSENNKWSKDVTPELNVTIPFIRMLAGPMDYTPGVMANANPRSHHIDHFRPMGIGTRAHEVAKYVVFESPLQMLCDSPSRYLREEETTRFIARIPTVWDDTLGLPSRVGDFVTIARRKGAVWYVAAMSDEEARAFEIDFSFLGKGRYKAEIFRDGVNAHNFAEDYRIEERTVQRGEKLKLSTAPGGGWSAILTPE